MNTKQIRKLVLVSLLSTVSFQSVVAASASDVDTRASGPSFRGMALAVGAAFATTVAGATGPKLTDTVTASCSDGRERTDSVALHLHHHCLTPTLEEMCGMVQQPEAPGLGAAWQRAHFMNSMDPLVPILQDRSTASGANKPFHTRVKVGAYEHALARGIRSTDHVTEVLSLAAARDHYNSSAMTRRGLPFTREDAMTGRLVGKALEQKCGYPASEEPASGGLLSGLYNSVAEWWSPPRWTQSNSVVKDALAGLPVNRLGCEAKLAHPELGDPKHTVTKRGGIMVDNPMAPGNGLPFRTVEEARVELILAGAPYPTEKPGMFARALDSLSCWWNPSEADDGIDHERLATLLAISAPKGA